MVGSVKCSGLRQEHSTSTFASYRVPPDSIGLAVRWYLRYRLSYDDLTELLAERGIHVHPTTIYDRVQHFTPLYQEAARVHRRVPSGKWSVDETYIKAGGISQYVFRVIDVSGSPLLYPSGTKKPRFCCFPR
jgi:IS6 family transposase